MVRTKRVSVAEWSRPLAPLRNNRRAAMKDQVIRLWDGKPHNLRVVESICPELVDYARSHARLEEEIPLDRRRFFRGHIRLGGTASAVLFVVVWLGILWDRIQHHEGKGILEITAAGICIMLLVFVMTTAFVMWIDWYGIQEQLPLYISVEQGMVTVRSPFRVFQARLDACEWWLGKSTETLHRKTIYAAYPAVILVLPTYNEGGHHIQMKIPCGCTEESFRRWKAFLTLAGVKQKGKYGRTILSNRDRDKFLDMLDDPTAKPNEALDAAARRYKKSMS